MNITCAVTLDPDDTKFTYTPDEAADQVMAALSGDPASDYCTVTIQRADWHGAAGTSPTSTIPAPE